MIHCKNASRKSDIMVQTQLTELRQVFIKEKTMECNKKLMQEIELQADSILIYLSKRTKYDSLRIPHDSIRPEKPSIEFPKYRNPEKPE